MKKSIVFILTMGILLTSQVALSQKATTKKEKLVVQFLDGFTDPAQWEGSLALLANDYTFRNPMVSLTSKDEFVVLAAQIAQVVTAININQIVGQGNWVAVRYEFQTAIPGVTSNLATEWFRVEKGLIHESHLIYDASEWRKVYAQMQNSTD
ncbi:MAG: nuclear transport factor 2 family protein [Bacteroidota bacterium]